MTQGRDIQPQLESDLDQVQTRLQDSLHDLTGPLGELVRPQLRAINPLIRAGAVLTTAYSLADYTPAPAQPPLARLLSLAAAVEMLYIALTLHTRLVHSHAHGASSPLTATTQSSPTGRESTATTPSPAEKTVLGGTILAGDYCFSRASQLAAKTEHPQVVGHFAQTLQMLSEGLLRDVFDPPQPTSTARFDEKRMLLLAGVEGTLLLHDYPLPTLSDISQHSPSSDPNTPLPDRSPATISNRIMAHAHAFTQATPAAAPTGDNGYHHDHGTAQPKDKIAHHWLQLHSWLENTQRLTA